MEAPDQQYYSRVKAIREQPGETTVMFVGAPGAGKSSLINTLVNLVDSSDESPKQGIDRSVPTAPPDLMGGHTMRREPVKLTDTLTIVDNRGWQDWGNEEALQEFCAQINGERSFVEKVDWEKGGKSYKQVSGMPLVVAKKITCIAVVINGEGGVDAVQDFKKLIDTCIGCIGRIPTVVVTHKDKMSDDEMKEIQSTLEKVYGISKRRIFIIRNMSVVDAGLEDDSNSRLLDFLDCSIADGKKGAEFHDQKKELNEMILESQKKNEASEKKEREVEEAEAAARELKVVEREKEFEKASHEKIQVQIATSKAKALAQLEEDMKRDERKSAQNMNKEKEEIVKMQLTAQEQTVAEQKIAFEIANKKEKANAQCEEDMKKDELRSAIEMNKLKEKREKDAQEHAKEQNELTVAKQKALVKINEDTKKEELRHDMQMNSQKEQKWFALQESAQKINAEVAKHAIEAQAKELARIFDGPTSPFS